MIRDGALYASKRPRSEIQSVIVHQRGQGNEWVPRKFERYSWVTLNAPKKGKWAHTGEPKAIIKGFKFKPNSSVLESVLVSHAYSIKQLYLERKPEGQVNYLYPSKWEDWEDPASILDVIVVMHADIGESTRGTRTHKELLEAGIFFYNAAYDPPSKTGKFGKLVPLPLPPLNDPSWPVPDMQTSESFRHQLFCDFQSAMKPSTGARVCSIRWFMPFHVMVDLFSVQSGNGMRRTSTLFVFKPISESLFASLMDNGWDVKIVAGSDVVRCQVLRNSVTFRYHIGRCMLYSTFGYVRDRLVGGTEWIAMDQIDSIEMLSIEVEMLDGTMTSFQVGGTWNFGNLREELGFYLSEEQRNGWVFQIVYPEQSGKQRHKKINRRQEKKMVMTAIGDGNHLRLISS